MIGQPVSVTIDRPLGSRHPSYPDLVYKLNYGYVPGTLAPDGEPIDAYVLGPNHALGSFQGIVIAAIDRLDDVEGKLVVADDGAHYTDQEIVDLISFQEQFFDSRLTTS